MTEELLVRLLDKVENRYYGKYRGLVEDNKDPENRGRLRLRIPSVLGKDVVSGWALPCAPYGGMPDQGFFFIPEEQAGVWVEFEEGNLDYPVWVGTFWAKPGGESELPKANGQVQDPPTQKIIKTKKGHTIRLEDAEGDQKIVISHGGGARIEIDKNGSVLIADQDSTFIFLNAESDEVTLFDQHQNLITMKADGIVIGNKGGFLEMKNGKMKVSSDSAVQISAKDVILNASSISLGGEKAIYSVLVGELLAAFLDTHVHPHPMGPTLAPTVPLTSSLKAMSSQAVKII